MCHVGASPISVTNGNSTSLRARNLSIDCSDLFLFGWRIVNEPKAKEYNEKGELTNVLASQTALGDGSCFSPCAISGWSNAIIVSKPPERRRQNSSKKSSESIPKAYLDSSTAILSTEYTMNMEQTLWASRCSVFSGDVLKKTPFVEWHELGIPGWPPNLAEHFSAYEGYTEWVKVLLERKSTLSIIGILPDGLKDSILLL
ncbi:hypothetical protein BT96DRAFT_939045 [Gymnopus androsaceus JB14]|uniref:Uncharacterized protein n=1 Tax=Gymnopus androsaceus JB14 TaxID=1447944 RepID=A0A6A4HSE1_9AGAR|nr:hypothetical protein BT96DRAFT_939045 [Gymnopus androsaceus JB14]